LNKTHSLIIPAYNERERLPRTLREAVLYLKRRKDDYEIIVVSDGSSDGTDAIVENFSRQEQNIKLLANGKNLGKGYSVQKGMLAAKGDYILFMDADNSTPISELDKLGPYLENYDVVIGSRALPRSNIVKRQARLRESTGKLFNFFIQLLLLPGIKDSQCGFKLFKREAGLDIFKRASVKRFCFDVEILCLARQLGYKIAEVPVTWVNSKPSKVSFFKDAPNILFDFARLIWRYAFRRTPQIDLTRTAP